MISLLWFLLGVALLFWLYALAVLLYEPRYMPAVRPESSLLGSLAVPLVSIILPARNEEHNLPRCLRSLMLQDYPRWEIIVINDRSRDRTGAVAREFAHLDPRIQVLQGQELPDDWLGKSWANYQGVQRAVGDWLLFTDADTYHQPGGLRGAMGLALQADLDALTLAPFLECLTFWEKVFQPAMYAFIAIHMPAFLVNRPTFPLALANGQYILIRRDIYQEIGGHQAIRDRIVDDKALAENLRRHGRRILVANGMAVLRTRMYRGLRDLWYGWSKNLMAGMGNRVGLVAAGVVALLVHSVLPFAALGTSLVLGHWEPVTLGLSAVACALLVSVRAGGLILLELSPLYALLHPLAALLLAGILINSAIRSRSGMGVVWKDRVYRHPR